MLYMFLWRVPGSSSINHHFSHHDAAGLFMEDTQVAENVSFAKPSSMSVRVRH